MKSGFVYLWKDCKRNKYYLGSHSGDINDGYLGSNKKFLSAYKSRPETFRRRILEFYDSCENSFIRNREEKWLSLIRPEELNIKYYNMKIFASGGDIYSYLSDEDKRISRLKSNSKIRKLLKDGIDLDLAEKIVLEENIKIKSSKKKPGETWTGRNHTESTKKKQSIYRLENPTYGHSGKTHSDKSKLQIGLKNPNRKSISTPIGNFYSVEDYCKSNPIITPNGLRLLFKSLDVIITKHRARRCPLLSLNDVGKTPKELGYNYVEDSDVVK